MWAEGMGDLYQGKGGKGADGAVERCRCGFLRKKWHKRICVGRTVIGGAVWLLRAVGVVVNGLQAIQAERGSSGSARLKNKKRFWGRRGGGELFNVGAVAGPR